MIVLGGWLFADLLLGLAMLFLTANTVGTAAPSPTPTATPNRLSTAMAQNGATQTALANQISQIGATSTAAVIASKDQAAAATATAIAQATQQAMSASERATAAAQATKDAIAAQATLAAFATQNANGDASTSALTNELATAAAVATEQAALSQATIEAQATQAAEVAAIATQNASSGANDVATAQAAAVAAQQTAAAAQSVSDSTLATSQAESQAAQATLAAAAATSTVLANDAANAGLEGNLYIEISLDVNGNGLLNGTASAERDAVATLKTQLAPYTGCKVGFVIAIGGGTITQGGRIGDTLNQLLIDNFPEIFSGTGNVGISSANGDVDAARIHLYFRRGCTATANITPTPDGG